MLQAIVDTLSTKPAVKTVDSVLATFNQTIADLEAVTKDHEAKAAQAELDRVAAEQRRDQCHAEAVRATDVATRLRQIFSV